MESFFYSFLFTFSFALMAMGFFKLSAERKKKLKKAAEEFERQEASLQIEKERLRIEKELRVFTHGLQKIILLMLWRSKMILINS